MSTSALSLARRNLPGNKKPARIGAAQKPGASISSVGSRTAF
jgi:hypothetical protein